MRPVILRTPLSDGQFHKPRRKRRFSDCCVPIFLCLVLTSVGCVRHINPYNPKVRAYQGGQYAAPDSARTEGSLWSEGAPGLFEDARARRVGDIVTIRIDERADATRDASTKTGRKAQLDVGVSSFFAAMQQLAQRHPGLTPEALMAMNHNSEFEGGGSTTRSGNLTAILPARIREQLPNGDFFIEGNKVLLLNEEESHLYISGVIRPIDIQPDNSVPSSVIADVELEYTGRGVVSERQSPGFFSRLIDLVWPF